MSYDSNAKQSYGRGWAMNRIVERLPFHPRDCTVVGLAGEDRDRPGLVKRGFLASNYICVDRDHGPVELVRSNGGLAIQSEITRALIAWPQDWPIHVLLLDFNCGIEQAVSDLAIIGLHAPAIHPLAVVYINLQRGRDWAGRLPEWKRHAAAPKNRAWNFLAMYQTALLSMFPEMESPTCRARTNWERHGDSIAWQKPYRQRDGGVLMDGAVFSVVKPPVSTLALQKHYAEQPWWREVRSRLAALRAVRTRKAA